MLAPILAKAETRARDMVVLAFGDSLTAGYGVVPAESFPVLLETTLRQKGAQCGGVRRHHGGRGRAD